MTTKLQYMIWLLLLSLFSCNDPTPETEATGITILEGYAFPYNMGKPDQTFEMPDELEEISGLGLSDDGNTLAAVQDEDGEIFLVNRYTGEVQAEIEFWKDGDYEGIEFVGDDIYVVKSTGTVYEVLRPGEEQPVVNKYNFFLDGDNDVEGLAYDADAHRLLLACKGNAGHDKAYPNRKAVYGFDLRERMLLETPVYFVELDSVRNYLGQSPAIWKLAKLLEFFNPEEEFGFSPSAIAIHPLSGYLYMTSSVGKMLIVMRKDGQIVHIEKLNKRVHPQPEGLCFAKDGTLFLSNEEGKGADPVIYRFDYKPAH